MWVVVLTFPHLVGVKREFSRSWMIINYCDATYFELLLHLREFLHLLPQLERGHDGVWAGEGHEGGTGERPVRVEARAGALQRVIVLLGHAVRALTRDRVRPLDGMVPRQEHLDHLVVIIMRGQDEGRDIRRELALLLSPEERIAHAGSPHLVLPGHVRGVLDHDLDGLGDALGDGVQQGLLDVLEAEFVEEELDGVHGLRVDGEVESVAAHVVHAVDVEVGLGLLEGLADDGHVPRRRRVEEEPLLVGELQQQRK